MKRHAKQLACQSHPFQFKTLNLAIAVCLGAVAPVALANPIGASVASGSASFASQGSTLTVTNSNGAIINWQQFNIGTSETTRFVQPNAQSSVLNRVVGGDPSQILGTLQSNGQVFLINPNGILFGRSAVIDLPGLIASTLNLSNADFQARKFTFTGGGFGPLVNQGRISTPLGGSIMLIGSEVRNEGIIATPQGQVILAAGNSVSLVDTAGPELSVTLSANGNKAVNLGEINAAGGKIDIFGALIEQQGVLRADSASVDQQGRIVLKASESNTVSGTVSATGSAGKGGDIQVLGQNVTLTGNARLDASGITGGGSVLVGGDLQGKNPAIANAQTTTMEPGAIIKSDAVKSGDGGKVVLWSDNTTRAAGTISARGGEQGGDGGFVEVSGKERLVYQGRVDTRAPLGKTGTLLLDPTSITLVAGAGADDNSASATLYGDNILAGLNTSNIVLQTSAGGSGDITFTAGNYDFSSAANPNSLTLLAYGGSGSTGNISLPSGTTVTMRPGAGLNMVAGWDGVSVSSPAVVATPTAGGGNLSLTGTSITVQSGAVELRAAGSASVGNISTTDMAGTAGSIGVIAEGNLNVSGTLSATGYSAGGFIGLAGGSGLTISGAVNATGNMGGGGEIQLNSGAGNIVFSGTGNVTTSTFGNGVVNASAPAGSISSDSPTATNPAITAQNLVIKADKGIHGAIDTSGPLPLLTKVGSLDITHSGGSTTGIQGAAFIQNTGALTLADLDGDTYSVKMADGTQATILATETVPGVTGDGHLILQDGISLASGTFGADQNVNVNSPINATSTLTLIGTNLNINQNVNAWGIILSGDNLQLSNSAFVTSASDGWINIGTATASRPILLNATNTSDGTALWLDTNKFGQFVTPYLSIGGLTDTGAPQNSGGITVMAPVVRPDGQGFHLFTSGDINFNGGSIFVGSSSVNTAGVSLHGANITLDAASGHTAVEVAGAGPQTIEATGTLTLKGGDDPSEYAHIRAETGAQFISAQNISLLGGSGSDTWASIQSHGGNQTINLNATGSTDKLWLKGGSGSGAAAEIGQGVGSGTQTVNIAGGATLLLEGGSGADGAHGEIWNDGTGAQNINFTAGGLLRAIGGTVGVRNWSGISGHTGDLTVSGNPDIHLTGGASSSSTSFDNSNDAYIGSEGNHVSIQANSVILEGGGGAFNTASISGGAWLSTPTSTKTISVNAANGVSLTSGTGPSSMAFIGIGPSDTPSPYSCTPTTCRVFVGSNAGPIILSGNQSAGTVAAIGAVGVQALVTLDSSYSAGTAINASQARMGVFSDLNFNDYGIGNLTIWARNGTLSITDSMLGAQSDFTGPSPLHGITSLQAPSMILGANTSAQGGQRIGIRANTLVLDSTISLRAGAPFTNASGLVRINPLDVTKGISIADSDPQNGSLWVDASKLSTIHSDTLVFGIYNTTIPVGTSPAAGTTPTPNPANSGDINISAAITGSEGTFRNLSLFTRGNIAQTAPVTLPTLNAATCANCGKLELRGANVSLDSANQIGFLVGELTGNLSFRNNRAFQVGGMATTGGNVALNLAGSATDAITLTGQLNAGTTGNVILVSSGDITESSNSGIVGNQLSVKGQNVALDMPNQVNALNADVTGNLSFQNAKGFQVASIKTTGGNALLNLVGTASDELSVVGPINTGAGVVALASTGNITEGTGASITGSQLHLKGGNVTLDSVNQVNALDADVSGNLSFKNGKGFQVAGIKTTGGNVSLSLAGGAADVMNITGQMNAGTGAVSLVSSGSIYGSSTGPSIIGGLLDILAPYGIDGVGGLQTQVSRVSGLSALAGGNINLVNFGGLVVGPTTADSSTTAVKAAGKIALATHSPLTINGSIATAGDVALTAGDGGPLTIAGNVSTTSGTVTLAGGSLTRTGLVSPNPTFNNQLVDGGYGLKTTTSPEATIDPCVQSPAMCSTATPTATTSDPAKLVSTGAATGSMGGSNNFSAPLTIDAKLTVASASGDASNAVKPNTTSAVLQTSTGSQDANLAVDNNEGKRGAADIQAEVKTAKAVAAKAEAEAKRAEAEAKQAEAEVKTAKTPEAKAQAKHKAEMKRAEAEAKKAEAEVKRAEADVKQAEADNHEVQSQPKGTAAADGSAPAAQKQAQTETKQIQAEVKKVEAQAKKAEAESKQAAVEAKLARTPDQKAAAQKTVEAKKIEADARKTEAQALKTEADAKKAEAEAKTASTPEAKAAAEKRAETKRTEAAVKKTEAAGKQALAEGKQAEAKGKQAESQAKEAQAEAKQAETEARTAKTPEQKLVAAQKAEVKKTEAEGKRMEAEARKVEAEGKKMEAEAKKAEVEVKRAEAEIKQAKAAGQKVEAEKRVEAKRAEVEVKKVEAAAKQAEAEAKQNQAEAKQIEAEAKGVRSAGARSLLHKEVEAKHAEAEQKHAEAAVKKAEAEVRKVEAVAKKAEAEGKKAEAQAKRAEMETKKTEMEAKRAEAEKKRVEAEQKAQEHRLAMEKRKEQHRLESAKAFAAVVTGGANRAALENLAALRHELKTEALKPALQILASNPAAADLPPCDSGSSVCIPTVSQAVAAALPSPPLPKISFLPQIQRKVAVVIGVNNYADPSIPSLESAVPDATAVGQRLQEHLGYDVRVINDATRADIVTSLNKVSEEVGPNDSVTVYYAGHGYLSEKTKTGYWIPADAKASSPANWISNNDIAKLLSNIPAKQVMLVSDSCYSGSLTKEQKIAAGTGSLDPSGILAKRSVTVMSSGGEEPVSDEGKEGHSIFAYSFMNALKGVKQVDSGVRIFEAVKKEVSTDYPQTPQYGGAVSAGHTTGGDYLLENRSY